MRELLSPKEAAHLLGVHTKTLETWRRTGKGPPALKIGGTLRARVRYRGEDVEAWAAKQPYRKKEVSMQHDRDYWRSCSTSRLIEEGKKNPTTELCIALAERLEDEEPLF